MDITATIQLRLIVSYASMSALTLLQWCFYFYFIIQHEIRGRERDFSWQKVFTPLNIPLIVGTASLLGVYITHGVNISYNIVIEWGILFTLEQALVSTVIWSYIFYSWRRSGKLLRSVFSPVVYKFMYYLVLFSPIVFYLPVVPAFWRMCGPDPTPNDILSTDLQFFANILMGFTCAALDFIFVVAFVKNLFLSYLAGDEVNREFLIVSVHGGIACLVCFVSVGVYGASGITADVERHAVLVCISQGLFNLVGIALFSMKFSLYKQKVFEETHHDPIEQMMRSKSVKEDLGIVDVPAVPSRRESGLQLASFTVADTLKNFHPLRETASTRIISVAAPGSHAGRDSITKGRDSLSKVGRESLVKRDSSSSKSAKGSKEMMVSKHSHTRESVHATRESLKRCGLGVERDSVLGSSGAELKSLRSIQAMSVRSIHSVKSGSATPRDSLRKEKREEAPDVPSIPKDIARESAASEHPGTAPSLTGSHISRDRSLRKGGSPSPVRREKEKDASSSTIEIHVSVFDRKNSDDV
ncbi:UNVERIFIED_CONTAM: hypothetical protein HDU68_002241 [Siphonaria sp. JEL0065]|nr:hypothetical protein HDU68_002241 [Siphonaria sp. JEL0065]